MNSVPACSGTTRRSSTPTCAVAFSWDDETKLGGRIFNTSQEVRDYTVAELLAATARR